MSCSFVATFTYKFCRFICILNCFAVAFHSQVCSKCKSVHWMSTAVFGTCFHRFSIGVLLVQSLCAQHGKAKLTTSEFAVGSRRHQLRRWESQWFLKSILRKCRVQASFMSGEGKMGGSVFVKTQAPSRIPLMTSVSKAETISLKAMETTQV